MGLTILVLALCGFQIKKRRPLRKKNRSRTRKRTNKLGKENGKTQLATKPRYQSGRRTGQSVLFSLVVFYVSLAEGHIFF